MKELLAMLFVCFLLVESNELVTSKDDDILERLFRDLNPALYKAVAVESTVLWLTFFTYINIKV